MFCWKSPKLCSWRQGIQSVSKLSFKRFNGGQVAGGRVWTPEVGQIVVFVSWNHGLTVQQPFGPFNPWEVRKRCQQGYEFSAWTWPCYMAWPPITQRSSHTPRRRGVGTPSCHRFTRVGLVASIATLWSRGWGAKTSPVVRNCGEIQLFFVDWCSWQMAVSPRVFESRMQSNEDNE